MAGTGGGGNKATFYHAHTYTQTTEPERRVTRALLVRPRGSPAATRHTTRYLSHVQQNGKQTYVGNIKQHPPPPRQTDQKNGKKTKQKQNKRIGRSSSSSNRSNSSRSGKDEQTTTSGALHTALKEVGLLCGMSKITGPT